LAFPKRIIFNALSLNGDARPEAQPIAYIGVD